VTILTQVLVLLTFIDVFQKHLQGYEGEFVVLSKNFHQSLSFLNQSHVHVPFFFLPDWYTHKDWQILTEWTCMLRSEKIFVTVKVKRLYGFQWSSFKFCRKYLSVCKQCFMQFSRFFIQKDISILKIKRGIFIFASCVTEVNFSHLPNDHQSR
jgi:hypothetical protein